METQGTPTFIPTHPHTETQCSMLPHANMAMVQIMDTKKGNGEETQGRGMDQQLQHCAAPTSEYTDVPA
jgi:hypothetical protein